MIADGRTIADGRMIADGRTIGVRGSRWRARVDQVGTIHPSDATLPLAWHVAGDDRWYSPATEPTVRQKWYSGYPVAETRMRVGSGDVVVRTWCVADHGGWTLLEVENDTPATVAVAFTRADIVTSREIVANPPQGIDLPAGSVVLPLGHRATLRVGLAHSQTSAAVLPDNLPSHQQVVRGWETACDVASRVVLADHTIVAEMCRARSDLLLGDEPRSPLAAIERVRLGERHADAILDIVDAAQSVISAERRARRLSWRTPHLLAHAARACVLCDDERAAGDIGRAWLRLADTPVEDLPPVVPSGLDAICWTESLLARPEPSGGRCEVLPHGIPETWWGANFEGHGLVADPFRTLSYAVRWHGARPALLWEVSGAPGLVLTGGGADADWHSVDASGETLLAAPTTIPARPDDIDAPAVSQT